MSKVKHTDFARHQEWEFKSVEDAARYAALLERYTGPFAAANLGLLKSSKRGAADRHDKLREALLLLVKLWECGAFACTSSSADKPGCCVFCGAPPSRDHDSACSLRRTWDLITAPWAKELLREDCERGEERTA